MTNMYIEALQLILGQTGGDCEHSTSGIGSCWKDGRAADAEFGADQACPSCIAHAALEGTEYVKVRAHAALDALILERNTWAKQMADLRGELEDAITEAEKHRDRANAAEVESTGIEAAMLTLAEGYDNDYSEELSHAADNIRREVSRWQERFGRQ